MCIRDSTISFKVKGAGTYRAGANGNPASLESFQTPKMKVFSGMTVSYTHLLDGGMVGSFEKTFHVGDGKAETGFQQTCGTDFLTGCEKRSRLAIEDVYKRQE